MSKNIKPIETPLGQGIAQQIQQAEDLGQVMRHYNIRDAVAHNGDRYKYDAATGEQQIASKGVCITLKEHTVTVEMQRPGASLLGTLNETRHLTQQMQAAMGDTSQSTVSRRRKLT